MKNNVMSATRWVMGGYLMSQLIRLGSNLILTRLLLPEMFGVMAIITTVTIGINMCTDIGLKQNIVRHEHGQEPEYLNTAWTLKIIRGVFLFCVIVMMGLSLEWWNSQHDNFKNTVYAYPDLPKLLYITGFNAFITGFGSTKIWLAQRNLQLNRVTLLELATQFCGITFMVVWAYKFRTIWGIVLGNLFATILLALFSHIVLKGQNNKFYWNKAIALEFLHFGKWLFASTLITFFALHGDRIIIGKFLTPEKFGIYAIAYFIVDSVNTILGKLADGVFFPVLSQTWRNNKAGLKKKYYRIRVAQDALVLTVAGFLYASAPVIIDILYEDRYKDAGWMLRILSIALIGSTYTLGSRLLIVMGHPFVRTVIVTARAILLWTTLPIALELYGLNGGLYAVSCNIGIEIFIIIVALHKYKVLTFYREFIMLPVALVGYALGMGFNQLYAYLLVHYPALADLLSR